MSKANRQSLDGLLNAAKWAILRKEPEKAVAIYDAMIREIEARKEEIQK